MCARIHLTSANSQCKTLRSSLSVMNMPRSTLSHMSQNIWLHKQYSTMETFQTDWNKEARFEVFFVCKFLDSTIQRHVQIRAHRQKVVLHC